MNTAKQTSDLSAYVSVIIPVYNDMEGLAKTLPALSCQTYPETRYEIIVIDNGSDQDTFSIVRQFPEVLYTVENKVGSYAARNKGISLAKGSILAFLDSSCIPASDWLEQGVKSLENSDNVGLVGGRVVFSFIDPNKPTAIELYDSITYFDMKRYIEQYHFSGGGNLFTFRRIMEDVGLFNDSLKSGGDYEWGNRVHDRGYRLVYADKAVVTHPARNSFKEAYTKALRVGGGFHDINQSSNQLASFYIRMLPPVRRIIGILKNDRVPTAWEKFKVILLVILLKYASLFEEMRLSFGGNARRS